MNEIKKQGLLDDRFGYRQPYLNQRRIVNKFIEVKCNQLDKKEHNKKKDKEVPKIVISQDKDKDSKKLCWQMDKLSSFMWNQCKKTNTYHLEKPYKWHEKDVQNISVLRELKKK